MPERPQQGVGDPAHERHESKAQTSCGTRDERRGEPAHENPGEDVARVVHTQRYAGERDQSRGDKEHDPTAP